MNQTADLEKVKADPEVQRLRQKHDGFIRASEVMFAKALDAKRELIKREREVWDAVR